MKLRSGIVWRKVGDSVFIIDPINEKIHELNETASLIFEMLLNSKKTDEIVKKILKEYDVDEKILRDDVISISNELKEKGVFCE